MNSGRHYLISPEGSYAWDLSVNPIRVDSALTAGLMANARLTADRLLSLTAETNNEFGAVRVLVGAQSCSWRVAVYKLHVRSAYRLLDGVHVPNFGHPSDPVLDLVWEPPMEVYFLVDLQSQPGISGWRMVKQWLFAAAPDRTTWRLPLPNLYADCHLCHGMPDRFYDTQLEAVRSACNTLQQSLWNSDLAPSLASAQAMFRWKPTAQGSFEQQAMLNDGGPWTGLCTKVGVDHLTEVL